jgi:hypothetical protein
LVDRQFEPPGKQVDLGAQLRARAGSLAFRDVALEQIRGAEDDARTGDGKCGGGDSLHSSPQVSAIGAGFKKNI